MDGRVVVVAVAAVEVHLADVVLLVGRIRYLSVAIAVKHQRKVYVGSAWHRVGSEGDEVLVETVIALVGQQLGDALALCLEVVYIELHAAMKPAMEGVVHAEQA